MTAVSTGHRSEARQLLILVSVAIVARAITFGNPVVHVDEQFYFATARAIWGGAIPYVDVWDRKPVGLFLIYLLPAGLGLPAGIYAYQLLALAALVATARLVIVIADRAGWRRGALWGGIVYIVWPNLLEGQGGQSPIFYNLLMAGAAALLTRGQAGRFRCAAPAMLAVGVAMQVKYSVVFEGIFFGIWCMIARWRLTRRWSSVLAYGAVLAALSLLPTLAAILAYALMGHLPAFWYANFVAILERQANPLINQYTDLGGMMLILSPLLAMAAIVARDQRGEWLRPPRLFAWIWLITAILGVLIFGTWFLHYGLPVLVPAAICASGIFDRSASARRWAVAALIGAALGGQTLLMLKRAGRGDAEQFYALARTADHGGGCLYVYSGPAMLYAATRHCFATRFTFPSALTRDRDTGAIGVDQMTELRRILASRPGTIVMQPPFEGESAATHIAVARAIAQNYRLRARLKLGREMLSVYQLR